MLRRWMIKFRELCAKAVASQDPAELGKVFGQLRAAIHEHTERLRSSVVNFPKSQRRAASYFAVQKWSLWSINFQVGHSLLRARKWCKQFLHRARANRNTRSAERRRHEKQRWFKKGQKWRTGCEGRISVIKRRHGLARCRYHGLHGMRRWVGLGVIADNLINLGRYLAPQPA